MSKKYYWEFKTSKGMPWTKGTSTEWKRRSIDPLESERIEKGDPEGGKPGRYVVGVTDITTRLIAELEYQVNKMEIILNLGLTKWINFKGKDDLWSQIATAGRELWFTSSYREKLVPYLESLNNYPIYDKLFIDLKSKCERLLSEFGGLSLSDALNPKWRIKPPAILNYDGNWATKEDFVYDRTIQQFRYFLEYIRCWAEQFKRITTPNVSLTGSGDFQDSTNFKLIDPKTTFDYEGQASIGGTKGSPTYGSSSASATASFTGGLSASLSCSAHLGEVPYVHPYYGWFGLDSAKANAKFTLNLSNLFYILPDTTLELKGSYNLDKGTENIIQDGLYYMGREYTKSRIYLGDYGYDIPSTGIINLWDLVLSEDTEGTLLTKYRTTTPLSHYSLRPSPCSGIRVVLEVGCGSHGEKKWDPQGPPWDPGYGCWFLTEGPGMSASVDLSINNIKVLKHFPRDYYKLKTKFVY